MGEKSKSNARLNALLHALQAGGDYSFYFLWSNVNSFAVDSVWGPISARFADNAIKVGQNLKKIPVLFPCFLYFDNFEKSYRENNFQQAAIYLKQGLEKLKTTLQPFIKNSQKYQDIIKLANQFYFDLEES